MKKAFLTLLLAFAAPLAATPTRIATIDNGNLIIPDDWDATYYYSLAPNFKNHFYFDQYSDGSSLGWAFLDLKVATLVLWFNKPFEAGALYSGAVAQGASIGLTSTAHGSAVAQAWEPREKRLQAPDNKLALGLAVPVADFLNLGLCFRLAQLDDVVEGSNKDGSGGPASYGNSLASFVDGAGGYYPVLGVSRYRDRQAANGLLLSPQFSLFADRFTLDAKLDLVWAGADNAHDEDVLGAAGTGSVTQTLKEKGSLSWQLKPRLRWMLDDRSSLVLRGSLNKLGFNTEHRVKGSFSGAGFNALQLAGYDHVDASQDLGVDQWEAILGWVGTWEHGKHSLVLGAGAKSDTTTVLDKAWQVAASPSSYDDLVLSSKVSTTQSKLLVPVFMGAEIGLAPWVKARGLVSRDFYANNDSQSSTETYASNGSLSGTQTVHTAGDSQTDWTVALGFGFNFGSFSWDVAVNSGLLGGPRGAAFVNPLGQSSLTYAY